MENSLNAPTGDPSPEAAYTLEGGYLEERQMMKALSERAACRDPLTGESHPRSVWLHAAMHQVEDLLATIRDEFEEDHPGDKLVHWDLLDIAMDAVQQFE